MPYKDPTIRREYDNAYRVQKREYERLLALMWYGGQCDCCGENSLEFLTFDHIDGGGTMHRKKDKWFCSDPGEWLRCKGYPEGYRILCMNCNWSLGRKKFCPHNGGRLSGRPPHLPF